MPAAVPGLILALLSVALVAGPVAGNVDADLDPVVPGTVEVVASSAAVRGAVAVIVRNGRARPVADVRVRAVAVDPAGRVRGRATTRGVAPSVIAPDGVALARLDFADPELPTDVELRFRVTAPPARSGDAALTVRDPRLSRPMPGPVAQTLDATVLNSTRRPVRDLDVVVICFGEARRPALAVAQRVTIDRLRPGEAVPLTLELPELCPTFLVGAEAVPSPRGR